MSAPFEVHAISEEDRPTRVHLSGGDVVAFTMRGPDKGENEDAAAVIAMESCGLLLVADGMGGQNGGRRASQATIELVTRCVRHASGEGNALRHATIDGLEAASGAVRELGVGAGATFAAITLIAGTAGTIHVGDSFVLHVGQRGRVKAQTVAHSPTGYAMEAGLLDEAAALRHEERHLVLNYVGQETMRIEVGACVSVAPHDTLLVASDGLADNLTLEEIVAIVRKGPLYDAADRLAAVARRRMTQPSAGSPSKPDDLTFLLYRPRGHS